jgi:hypothetical protein
VTVCIGDCIEIRYQEAPLRRFNRSGCGIREGPGERFVLEDRVVRKTLWWLRIVGVFYVALALMNVVFIAASQETIRGTIPFLVDDNGLHAFIDAWFTFVLAILAFGIVALYASRRPAASRMLVLALVVGELSYGVAGDVWLIARGYEVSGYLTFIAIHLVIAVTGALLLRGELRSVAPASSTATIAGSPVVARGTAD